MMNEEAIKKLKFLKSFHNGSYGESLNMAIKALEAQPCIEDYPTCTECEHYDSEKHYCPRFCQVIKDTLAEAQPSEEDFVKHKKEVLERIAKREAEIDKYIKELEKCNQQPCEDCINCISRESIKQKLQGHRNFYVNAYGGFSNLSQNDKSRVDEIDNCIAMVVNEPTVTPKGVTITDFADKCRECGKIQNELAEDCISRQAVIDYAKDTCLDLDNDDDTKIFCDEIKAMSSVTPQRPKGKWIYEMKVMSNPYTYKCSVCNEWEKDKTKYCPNCGVEMSGGGEDEG